MLKVAHLSDLHFSHPTFNPSQFINKRWIGNLNLLFFRKYLYDTKHLLHLPQFFDSLNVDHVCITGDFSSLSLDSEFRESKAFVDSFSQPVYFLPGNHDCYTKAVEKTRRFYHFFPSEDLKNQRIEKKYLGKGWWWIGLDCAVATPPFYSLGLFSSTMKKALKQILDCIPLHEHVIIGNHFPLYPTHRPMHDLQGAHLLQQILKNYPQVKLYLHGHDHKYYIQEERKEGLPLVFNSGSVAHRSNGTFYLFQLNEKECLVDHFILDNNRKTCSWVVNWQKRFTYNA
ncbi:MAG: metallophosphoesterase [Chlamydiales bacterium]